MSEPDERLPALPAKRYFTIGEVSELCGVKPYVLRYWEQEFTQLRPVKRRGNRRYYQHHEVLLIRRIRALLYDDGFTISGARNRLMAQQVAHGLGGAGLTMASTDDTAMDGESHARPDMSVEMKAVLSAGGGSNPDCIGIRKELLAIREILSPDAEECPIIMASVGV